jgi:anti-anti-sigma regulatory factor
MQYVSTSAAANSVEYVIDMVFLEHKSELAAGHLMACSTRLQHELPAMKRVVTVGGLSRALCCVCRQT